MSKQFTVSFPLSLMDGATAADARMFVQEALMRMHKDLQGTVQSPEEQHTYSQLVIPTSNQIEVEKA